MRGPGIPAIFCRPIMPCWIPARTPLHLFPATSRGARHKKQNASPLIMPALHAREKKTPAVPFPPPPTPALQVPPSLRPLAPRWSSLWHVPQGLEQKDALSIDVKVKVPAWLVAHLRRVVAGPGEQGSGKSSGGRMRSKPGCGRRQWEPAQQAKQHTAYSRDE